MSKHDTVEIRYRVPAKLFRQLEALAERTYSKPLTEICRAIEDHIKRNGQPSSQSTDVTHSQPEKPAATKPVGRPSREEREKAERMAQNKIFWDNWKQIPKDMWQWHSMHSGHPYYLVYDPEAVIDQHPDIEIEDLGLPRVLMLAPFQTGMAMKALYVPARMVVWQSSPQDAWVYESPLRILPDKETLFSHDVGTATTEYERRIEPLNPPWPQLGVPVVNPRYGYIAASPEMVMDHLDNYPDLWDDHTCTEEDVARGRLAVTTWPGKHWLEPPERYQPHAAPKPDSGL